VAQVERQSGQQMRGADRREMHPDRADGEALIGAAHHVHGDGVGIGGERLAAERAAPGVELPPGSAVGAAGAVAAGAGGAVGHGERTEQGGLQGQGGAIGGRPVGGTGSRRGAEGGGEGDRPWCSHVQRQGLRPRWRPRAHGRRVKLGRLGHGGSLEHLFSVRKAGLSDGTSFPCAHASVSGFSRVGENPRGDESISRESV
jgi:hypothetical protein